MANKLTTKWYIVHDNGKYFAGFAHGVVETPEIWGPKQFAKKFTHSEMIDQASKLYFKNISFEKVPSLWEKIIGRFRRS